MGKTADHPFLPVPLVKGARWEGAKLRGFQEADAVLQAQGQGVTIALACKCYNAMTPSGCPAFKGSSRHPRIGMQGSTA